MKTLIKYLFTLSLLSMSAANAAEVTTSSQATTLCKAEAMARNEDFSRSKTSRIKEVRGGYKIKLKVYLTDGSTNVVCDIKRDGALVYSES